MVIQKRFEFVTTSFCAIQSVAFFLLLWVRGMTFSLAGSSPVILAVVFFFAFGMTYRLFRQELMISGLAFALGQLFWAVPINGALAVVAVSWDLPVIDADLLQIDHALGFDPTRFSALLGSIPGAGGVLDAVYWASFPIALALTCALFISGERHRGAAVTFLLVSTITACAILGSFLPAKGSLVFQPLSPVELSGLPNYAGVWYLEEMNYLRSGANKIVDLCHVGAVLTFPSFHTCMLLIFLWGAFPLAWLRWPILILSVLTLLSVFPIGGHYLADVIGAAAIVIMALALVRRLQSSPLIAGSSRQCEATAARP